MEFDTSSSWFEGNVAPTHSYPPSKEFARLLADTHMCSKPIPEVLLPDVAGQICKCGLPYSN